MNSGGSGCFWSFVVVQVILIFLKWGNAINLGWIQVMLPTIVVVGIPLSVDFLKKSFNNTTSLN